MQKPDAGELATAAAPRRISTRLLWLAALIIALIVLSAMYSAWRSYRSTVASARLTLQLQARTLADATSRLLREVDSAADEIAKSLPADGTFDLAQLQAQLRKELQRLPSVRSLEAYDPRGQLLTTTDNNIELAPGGEIHPEVVALASGTTELRLTMLPALRIANQEDFVASKALQGRTAGSAGVVVLRISRIYLARNYETLDTLQDAALRLSSSSGTVLASYPRQPRGVADNAPPLSSEAAVQGYPATLLLTQPLHSATASWRSEQQASIFWNGMLVLVTALLLIGLAQVLRRREEAELARAQAEARVLEERKAEALSLLAAVVAHDFNNVLSAIVGYAELTQASASDADSVRHHVERLLTAAERARKLVRRVLTFDPRRSLEYARVRIAPVASEVVEQLRTTLPPRVAIELKLDKSAAAVFGDSTEIHQVIMNLCTNAIRAMPEGGKLFVLLAAVSIAEPRSMAVGEVKPGSWICLSITDQGMGIAAEHLGSIFDPLHTTSDGGMGTGLGLTVVRNIVLSMKGAVDVQTSPAGSRFSVYWPAADETEGAAGAAREPDAPGRGQSLLIIDDEPQLVALMEELVASLGFEAVGYSSPLQAIEALRREPMRFDAILTDERMPAMRGAEVARAAHALRPDLPVVLVTGYRSEAMEAEARSSGVVAVLDKPLQRRELGIALGQIFPAVRA